MARSRARGVTTLSWHSGSGECTPQRPRKTAPGTNAEAVEREPRGQRSQLGGQRLGYVAGVVAGLEISGMNDQRRGRAVRLQVHPRDEPVSLQERQYVVAVHPLRPGHVDLDLVFEA